jgi:hypothetical protein
MAPTTIRRSVVSTEVSIPYRDLFDLKYETTLSSVIPIHRCPKDTIEGGFRDAASFDRKQSILKAPRRAGEPARRDLKPTPCEAIGSHDPSSIRSDSESLSFAALTTYGGARMLRYCRNATLNRVQAVIDLLTDRGYRQCQITVDHRIAARS